MTPDQICQALQQMGPAELKSAAAQVAKMFADKAEAIYSKDPENNGRIAQPYADMAHLFEEVSLVFEEDEPDIDDEPKTANTRPITVTQALESRGTDPWGGR